MKWLVRILHSIRKWWVRRYRRNSFTGIVRLESSVDPSADLAAGKIVFIGSGEKAKWLRLICPCGCGEVIALNLMPSHYPRWSTELHKDGSLTVKPSVDARSCGSHFWIRRNKIEWV